MDFKFYIHVITAVFALLTVAFPFAGISLYKLYRVQVIQRADLLIKFIRLQNIMLLITVITGFLIWGGFSFNQWLVTVLVFSIIYGGILSLMVRALKSIKYQAENNIAYDHSISGFIKWSTVNSFIIIALIIFKVS